MKMDEIEIDEMDKMELFSALSIMDSLVIWNGQNGLSKWPQIVEYATYNIHDVHSYKRCPLHS